MAAALFCLFNVLCLWLLLRRFNFSWALNIFIGSLCLYYNFSFLDYFVGNNVLRYTESQVSAEFLLLNMFLAGVLLADALYPSMPGENVVSGLAPPPSLRNVLIASYSLMAVGLIMYGVFIHFAYGGLHDMLHVKNRMELYHKKKDMGSLLIGLNIFLMSALMRITYYLVYRKKITQQLPLVAVVITVSLLALQYLNGDRSNLIFFLLPVVVVFLFINPKINYHLLLAVPVLLVLMQVIAIQRGLKNSHEHRSVVQYFSDPRHHKYLNLSQHGEFLAPGKVDAKILAELDSLPTRYGGTYVDVVANLAPAWMHTQRPALPAEWYASTFYPDAHKKGGGFGFSVISESLINFYFFGPFIYGLLIGLLLLYMQRKLMGASFFYFVAYCALQMYVFILPRSGIAGLVKPALIAVIIPVGFAWLVSRFMGRSKTQAREGSAS